MRLLSMLRAAMSLTMTAHLKLSSACFVCKNRNSVKCKIRNSKIWWYVHTQERSQHVRLVIFYQTLFMWKFAILPPKHALAELSFLLLKSHRVVSLAIGLLGPARPSSGPRWLVTKFPLRSSHSSLRQAAF